MLENAKGIVVRRANRLVSWLSIGIGLLLLVSCLPLINKRPTPTPRPEPIDLRDLLVTSSVFPPGWRAEQPSSSLREVFPRAQESLGVTFRREGYEAIANHAVGRYSDADDAAFEYEWEHSREFGQALLVTPWATPEALPYQSTIADQYCFACAVRGDRSGDRFRVCVAVGRYGEFVSIFTTWVAPEYMTYANLERILKAIDERMARYLRGDAHRAWPIRRR
jgi:hypothetical protein